jgi:TP901 family phage tail tape measure protein
MADAQKTIDLIFNGIDKTGAATSAALENTRKFTDSVQSITAPIAAFTVGALKLEAGLLSAGVAMTTFAVKTAGDFDQSFRQISTLFSANSKELESFKAAILTYAEGSSRPLLDITESLQAAIGSGVDYTKSLDLIGTAEKLAVATRSDLKGTTETLVSTLNAYGLKTEDAGKVSDLLFNIIRDGKIEMGDLSRSLALVTPVAAASGVSLTEVGAAIATLTASGVQPSTAIEYLRSAISNIIKPSKEASDLAAELGINFDANTVKSKGLAFVLTEVAKATGGSTEKTAKLIGDIGGLTATLVLNGPQAEAFRESLLRMGNLGTVSEAFAKMSGSINDSMVKVGNAFKVLLIAVGTPLLDEFGGVAEAIAKIFSAVGVSVKEGGLKDVVAYVESLMKSLQLSIETVAKNLPAALAKADFSGFKGGVDAVIGAFGRLFSNIDLTTVDGLTRAIELAGAAFLGLSKFSAGVIESFKPLFDKLVEVARQVGTLNPGFFEMAGNIGGAAIQVTKFADALGGLEPWLQAIVGLMVAKQGISLVSGVATLATSIPLLTASVGLWTAGIAAGTAGIGLIVYALNDWIKAEALKNAAFATTVKLTSETNDRLKEFAASTGITAKSLDEVFKLHKDGVIVWDAASNSYKRAGDAMAGAGSAASSAQADFRKSEITLQNNAVASEKAAAGAGKLGEAQKYLTTYALKTVPILDSLTGNIIGYEQQLVKSEKGTVLLGKASDETGKSLQKIASETEKAKAAQEEWNKQLEKMKFEEKLKLIDQQTKLRTTQIEADAKKTVAAFESIGVSISSTEKMLTSLYGQFKDFDKISYSGQRKIQDQIDTENRRRDDSLALQKELIQVQINQMRAQTNALIKGDGLIKIDGAGLKPHLEAFMFEILRAIQLKVNKDGLKMLLGA